MAAQNEAQLYEIDRVEDGLKSILQSQVAGATIYKKRETDTAKTPRVEIVFTAQQNQGRRYLRYALTNSFAPAQPLNAWNYQIQPTIITNRSNNSGPAHATLVGLVRWALQYHRLLATITSERLPYHQITSIIETSAAETTVDDEKDLDMTRLTFSGVANIRDDAWPSAPQSGNEISTINTNGRTGANFSVGAISGLGFVISGASERYGIWVQTGVQTQPNLSAQGATAYAECTLANGALSTEADIASDLASTITTIGGAVIFSAVISGSGPYVITVTDLSTGTRTDIAAATSGFICAVTQQGT